MNFFKTNFDKTVEKLLVNFLSKIRYGKLTVQFPTGEERVFVGKEHQNILPMLAPRSYENCGRRCHFIVDNFHINVSRSISGGT